MMHYRRILSSLSSFTLFRFFCGLVVINNQFAAGIGPTDFSYDDFDNEHGLYFKDVPRTPVKFEQCTSGVPCRALAGPIRALKMLLNDLQIATEQHCRRSPGIVMEPWTKPPRPMNPNLQRRNHQKLPFTGPSKIPNFGQSMRSTNNHERSTFSPRQLFRQLPVQHYQMSGTRHEPYPLGQTGQNNVDRFDGFNRLPQTLVTGQSNTAKSKERDINSWPSDAYAEKRNKKRRRKLCSRRSSSSKKSSKPKLRIQEDESEEESSDETDDDASSDDATSPRAETIAVTTSSEPAIVDTKTDKTDKH